MISENKSSNKRNTAASYIQDRQELQLPGGLEPLLDLDGETFLHLGRIFKTEHILQHMIDPQARLRKCRGLLKGEQIHQLARDVNYANRGKITARDDKSQNLVCSCLTLIMACIVYWQAKELTRVMKEHNPEEAGFNLELLAHISPVGWGNIILYGEYFINRNLVRV